MRLSTLRASREVIKSTSRTRDNVAVKARKCAYLDMCLMSGLDPFAMTTKIDSADLYAESAIIYSKLVGRNDNLEFKRGNISQFLDWKQSRIKFQDSMEMHTLLKERREAMIEELSIDANKTVDEVLNSTMPIICEEEDTTSEAKNTPKLIDRIEYVPYAEFYNHLNEDDLRIKAAKDIEDSAELLNHLKSAS